MKKYIIIGIIVIAVLAVGAMAFGKNSGDDMPMASGSSEMAASESADDMPMTKSTNMVEVKDYAYGPKDITVKVGTTVTWTNKDAVAHTVSMKDGADGPDSELFGKGETYTYTFDKAGVYDYYCKPHPNMIGKVTVE